MKDDPDNNLTVRVWGFEASATGIIAIGAVVLMFAGFLAALIYRLSIG